MAQDRTKQIYKLFKEFPSITTIKETPVETLFEIDHTIRISPNTVYGLSLFIKIDSSFPKNPPLAIMPYCFQSVPITPPNINPTELEAYQWDPDASSLTDAVHNAFQNAADLWGSVMPPTMDSVALYLNTETDRLLEDIDNNPNCLDAYCYQLPIVKQMQEASRQTVSEVERVANENIQLRSEVEALYIEVKKLQEKLAEQVEIIKKTEGNTLLASVCTPEALERTLEADVRKLHERCRTVGKEALAVFQSDRKTFIDTLEQFKITSKQMHMIDLKRRAYRSQISK